ncbi:MAG: alpha-glucan family phosphorylase [candidate division KSB1 bacterium]|nr:alpha-glucan family phosphorylase [candidate division KSB1 bacterium]MDZ7301828.1 alpha-glucan family phosphorylase [candidate division KSB1 bacterium]MDZ7310211.1 alpha-glucan family phosphorylase [candidate division KSB1 bacterium]
MKLLFDVKYPLRCSKPFQRLPELAYNLWWSWHPEAQALFEQIDAKHWRRYHNPVKLLCERGAALRRLAHESNFVIAYEKIIEEFDDYMNNSNTWYARTYPQYQESPIAYFCAEFGFHECLPIYCGGLGVLAGDHTKSASDLGIPFVGIGLLYKNGYFTQRLDAQGNQLAEYPKLDPASMPVLPLRRGNGKRLQLTIELAGRRVAAQCWVVNVGRAQVILLDADLAHNKPKDRKLTMQLYGGDREVRIAQEILLGMGGVLALRALGITPGVWHLNEGHAAFVCFERLRELMRNKKLDFDHALEAITASTVFTTHTPVAAGNEAFSLPLMDKYFRHFCKQSGIELSRLLNLGLQSDDQGYKFFSMTVLALRLSGASNAVSQLHGKVSRALWKHLWPDIPESESPVTSITNGVRADTWIAPEMAELFNRHLEGNWRAHLDDPQYWQNISTIPDQELWRIHQLLKARLIDFARQRLVQQLKRRGASQQEIEAAATVLNPEALTIGFARRFASYKRADLIFSDVKRLEKLANHAKQPIQIIFAGKAHPQDREGQEILRRVYQMTQRKSLKGKVILLEDYDMNVGRHLVQGVDLWLNTPRRPLEASGTSGQKVPLNGGINCSILDGWWTEGYNGENGWAFGEEMPGANEVEQDRADARALYEVLEEEIIPAFYHRPDSPSRQQTGGRNQGPPPQWIKKMKASMATLIPQFNTEVMVRNYVEKLYVPTMHRNEFFESNHFATAAEVVRIKERLRGNWPLVHVTHVEIATPRATRRRTNRNGRPCNGKLEISAGVYLGELDPNLVQVEVYSIESRRNGTPETIKTTPMQIVHCNGDGVCYYQLKLAQKMTGARQCRIRVLPRHPALRHKHELGLIHWRDLK